ncbi:MAG: DUF993 family protein [Planctomycetota bacterium]|nr:DUF993 family protein [Planctomycetota bacterium]
MLDPKSLIVPNREIHGVSAILLPVMDGTVDWRGFAAHLERTFAAGLEPAVNMDTGYANLIDQVTRREVLRRTQEIASGKDFVAGVFVSDEPDSKFDQSAYASGMEEIEAAGGKPILFQSYGLITQSDSELVQSYQELSKHCDAFLFFELAKVFAPFGEIYSLNVYRQLMQIPNAIGAKHSSLQRMPEWERLNLRNQVRPDFRVFTGNDLAIDMVMYGSDYLLGLSTFAPDAFALRDAYWKSGDSRFHALNDLLQYLGFYTFRAPTPAYKHSAAMFLKIRGLLNSDETYSGSPTRSHTDTEVLQKIADDLDSLTRGSNE